MACTFLRVIMDHKTPLGNPLVVTTNQLSTSGGYSWTSMALHGHPVSLPSPHVTRLGARGAQPKLLLANCKKSSLGSKAVWGVLKTERATSSVHIFSSTLH